MRRAGWIAALALLAPGGSGAAPDLSAPREIGHFVVYPDYEEEHRFYLAPGDLEIATNQLGRPELHFLQMRYTGTELYGNAGESGSYSTLTFGLRLDVPNSAETLFLKSALRGFANLGRVELRPLPVTAFEAVIVYAPIGGPPSELGIAEEGYFEAEAEDDAQSDARSFWRERSFTIPMNEATSRLFWDLLQRGELAISVSYAFFSRGIHSNELATVDVSATEKEIEDELFEELRSMGVPLAKRPKGITERLLERVRAEQRGETVDLSDSDDDELPQRTQMVHAGSTALRVDAKRWPELFQRVDWNDEAPPAYAVVKVYCYDFANARRPDLFYKKIEIEAEAVDGSRIPLDAKFLYSQPDLYARTMRFPVAVHVDRPFRYRVTTASRDGNVREGPWIEKSTWGGILDITSAPGEGPGEQAEAEG